MELKPLISYTLTTELLVQESQFAVWYGSSFDILICLSKGNVFLVLVSVSLSGQDQVVRLTWTFPIH